MARQLAIVCVLAACGGGGGGAGQATPDAGWAPVPDLLVTWTIVDGDTPAPCPPGTNVGVLEMTGSTEIGQDIVPCTDGSDNIGQLDAQEVAVSLLQPGQTALGFGQYVDDSSSDPSIDLRHAVFDAYHARIYVSWTLVGSDGQSSTCDDRKVEIHATNDATGSAYEKTVDCGSGDPAMSAATDPLHVGDYTGQLVLDDPAGTVSGQSQPFTVTLAFGGAGVGPIEIDVE